jgi:hypothetical protein
MYQVANDFQPTFDRLSPQDTMIRGETRKHPSAFGRKQLNQPLVPVEYLPEIVLAWRCIAMRVSNLVQSGHGDLHIASRQLLRSQVRQNLIKPLDLDDL